MADTLSPSGRRGFTKAALRLWQFANRPLSTKVQVVALAGIMAIVFGLIFAYDETHGYFFWGFVIYLALECISNFRRHVREAHAR